MPKAQLNITYTAEGQPHRVTLHARSAEILRAALRDPAARGLKGEELVGALTGFSKGNVFRLDRYTADVRSDAPGGQPAVELFDGTGKTVASLRYQSGVPNDGAKGEPALWQLKGGRVHYQHMKNGLLDDAANGEPAERYYSDDGLHVVDRRYRDGKLTDGAKGEPAIHVRLAARGKTVLIKRYRDDVQTDSTKGDPAFIRYSADGAFVQEVHRMQAGVMQDSADGKPAFVRNAADGKTQEIRHMQAGQLQDTPARPARVKYRADGVTPRLVERYSGGVLTDGANGEPARERYSPATGQLLSIGHFRDGKRHDAADGAPAATSYRNGVLTRCERYRDGQLNDGPNGEPAVQIFTPEEDSPLSTLSQTLRYRNGQLNDADNGSPAIEKFSPGGEISSVERYRDGQLRDAADGSPAVMRFRDGRVTFAARAAADGSKQPLTDRELRALNGETPARRRFLPRFGR